MFYKMIENKCKEWYDSEKCTVRNLINYIEKTGQMRDAQIEAIKVYLFLKIGCDCQPLVSLFKRGVFNSIDLNAVELSTATRRYLEENPAAAALLEYSSLISDKGEQVSEKLEKQIKREPSAIDYDTFFRTVFYGISYTDYLFSLPMGAGKTYLMAAFIYLDLYFALSEPTNPAFAHNFIILAPSGLKSSVVPSLKTIQNFNPAWIIPEPAATGIKRLISFEVLDQEKTANKSNKTKNPNVQKIANHQPLSELFGLVAVTNAEKVILDRIQEKNGQISLFEESDDEKDRQANELRNLIGKLPSLSVFIDEVHHAVSDEIKLRAVVTKWAQNNTINSVIGFSGTPYLEKAEKFRVIEGLFLGSTEITNIVYYYPLINGVGNFLKCPVVKIADIAESNLIIEKGVREFLDIYRDKVYSNGLTAKLGIYCGTIEKLEVVVYPIVSRIIDEYGLSQDVILKFHKGNKQYKVSADSRLQFDILDKSISKIRIILLVQIGKEGWDCRSLTGIILSQEGDCPTNMVLQTSCRCLRQVVKGTPETALIYLNESNADKLRMQLEQQHHISLKEFSTVNNKNVLLKRYSRMAHLNLPEIDFYQLVIRYDNLTIEKVDTANKIVDSVDSARVEEGVIKTTNLSMEKNKMTIRYDTTEYGAELASFNAWVHGIMKGGFGYPTFKELMQYASQLSSVYQKITYLKGGKRYYSSKYVRKEVEANIRKAFYSKVYFDTAEEVINERASLLKRENLTSEIYTDKPQDYYPNQALVHNIIKDDKGKFKVDSKIEDAIRYLKEIGKVDMAEALQVQNSSHRYKDCSFHYLPYHTDSDFEKSFLIEVLSHDEIGNCGAEVYYNGDDSMTEFKIKCYKKKNGRWSYVGLYTPDFLIVKRKEGKIYKIIIVETKGGIYAKKPEFVDKKRFVETVFLKINNEAFGYERFSYLYLEDALPSKDRLAITLQKICEVFKEK